MHNIHFIPNATPRVSHCGYIIQQLTGFEADSFSPQYNISYLLHVAEFHTPDFRYDICLRRLK